MNEFDNVNGFLIEKGDKLFNTGNRSFKYGDGIFETMKVVDNKVLFWEDHLARMRKGMSVLKIDQVSFDDEKWSQEVQRVIHKNFYQFAKLRITVYRESPGLYTPMSNNMGFVIEGVRYDRRNYTFNPEGVTLGLYDELPKSVDALSNCKTTSALVYVMASIFKKEKQLDDVIILNANDKVCETSNANLFYVKDNKVYTPGLDQGCIAGVFRKQIVSCCKSLNIVLKETSVAVEDLLDADEIFITNMTAGVQGVNCLEIDGETYRKKLQLAKQFQTFFS